MQRYKLTLEYDGTCFCGYQVQPEKRTVESELERALEKIYGTKVKTFASGRTDAKVHSLGQVVHFDEPREIKNDIMNTLNAFLPDDVKVSSIEKVGEEFDARFNAKKKTYGYHFYLSRYEKPLMINRSVRLNDNLNIEKMKEACKYLIGEHDFTSFVARKSGKTNFVRIIYNAEILNIGQNEFMLKITGNGFLYNMVRIIMGTLVKVGEGKIKPEQVKDIIEAKDRQMAGKTLAPHGLYLLKVEY